MYAGGKLAAQTALPIGGILSDQPMSVLGEQLGRCERLWKIWAMTIIM